MNLHLGKSESCRFDKIVAVLDIENAETGESSREFIKRLQDAKMTVNLADDLPKSLVLAEDEMSETLYITSLSPQTLKKRSETGDLNSK